jgi:thiol-disulfide isomerase/thioredoxin
MNLDWVYRTGLVIGIVLSGLAFYKIMNQVILGRVGKSTGQLPTVLSGKPAILYFTTPDCVPCKTVQRPALRKLQEMLGNGLQVIEVDASQRPELAKQWGVLSVPTTFVIDPRGKARYVNHGVTRAEQLLEQIQKFERK